MFGFPTLMFMHKRGGFALCAQARCVCEVVKTIAPVHEHRRPATLLKNSREYVDFPQESTHSSRGVALICCVTRRRPPKATPPNRAFLRQLFGVCSSTPRAPRGRLPDSSRTFFGPASSQTTLHTMTNRINNIIMPTHTTHTRIDSSHAQNKPPQQPTNQQTN